MTQHDTPNPAPSHLTGADVIAAIADLTPDELRSALAYISGYDPVAFRFAINSVQAARIRAAERAAQDGGEVR